jgi:cyclophilin family peptidyl-prolyl cis-trans isomerase
MKRLLAPGHVSFLRVLFGLALAAMARGAAPTPLGDGLYAEFVTARGTVVCELNFEQAPLTVTSFVGLAEGSLGPAPRKPFFNGLTFHRVVPDFVVQGGDPLGTGDGGPGYEFADEFAPRLRHDAAGMLSMANEGPDTNGSQFFLTLRETNRLNYLHSVFGRTVRGLEVLPQIRQGDPMTVRILRVGSAARAFPADDAALARLMVRAKKYSAAREPGPSAHFADPDGVLPVEPPRAKNFNFKLANFERATGVKIVARLLARSPPNTDGRKLNEHAQQLAEQLGVAKVGALALYVADREEWKLWIGDDSAAAFMGRAGTVREFMQHGAWHEAKQALLDAARKTGDADYALQLKASAPDKQPPPGQRLKLQADAVLDSLIFKLEPK